MVFVLGLDRLDGTPIATMPDHLWTQHSAEIKHRFEAQQQHDARMNHRKTASCCALLGFTDFCKTFATVGGNMTQAMQDHAAATSTAPPPTAAPPTTVPGSAVVAVMPDAGSNVVLCPPGAPKPTPTPAAHQPPRAKPKIKKAHGQGMSKAERKELLANRMRKASPSCNPAQGTICPNSMNGQHCYQSRANVFKCSQCGAKK